MPFFTQMHVIPIADIRRHKKREDCWCKPQLHDVNLEDGTNARFPVVVHNAADWREAAEVELGMPLDGKQWKSVSVIRGVNRFQL